MNPTPEPKQEAKHSPLPCPFCGGEAEIVDRFNVKCSGCGAEINAQPGQSIDLWNTRAAAPLFDEMRDALEMAKAQLEETDRLINSDYTGSQWDDQDRGCRASLIGDLTKLLAKVKEAERVR